MPTTDRTAVVCDAGPLIALAGCGCLELLLTVFETLHVPQAVLDEATADQSRAGAREIAAFMQTHAQVHADRSDAFYRTLIRVLDRGEAQALSLARALGCAVLMDERLGRRVSIQHNIPVFGVLGVLLQAKRIGKIPRIFPILEAMQGNGYRFTLPLLEKVLMLAGEAQKQE